MVSRNNRSRVRTVPCVAPALTRLSSSLALCCPERITVSVRVLNPLQIDLVVRNIRLRARHTSKETGVTVTQGHVDVSPLPTSLSSSALSQYPSACPFVIASQDLLLPAGDAVVMALTLLPLAEGQLVIEGVQWDVLSLHGFHQFALPPRMMPLAPGKRGQPQVQADPSLSIPINPPAPLLSISLSHLPSQCFHGEYVQSALSLTNAGDIGLTKLSVRVSHPGFVLLGNAQALGHASPTAPTAHSSLSSSVSTPALSSHRAAPASSSTSCYSYDWSDSGRIHLSISLQPRQSVTLPLFIRGALEGQQLLSFLFRYESVDEAFGRFRLGYLERPMRVRPLMGVRLFNKPSFAEVKDSLIGVDIHDRQVEGAEGSDDEVDVRVERISVLSKCWIIAAIGEHPDTSLGGLPAARSISSQDLHRASRVPGGARSAAGVAASSSVHSCAVDSTMSPHSSLLLFCRITNLPSLSLPSTLLQANCPTQHSSVSFTAPDAAPSPAPTPLPADASLAPYSNLLAMEKALLMEEERQSLIINPAAVIADVGAPNKLDLILSWSLPSSSPRRFGFFHLPGVAIMKVLPSACPLKVHLSYPPVLTAAAGAFPLTFPVRVSIRNILEESAISFLFETLPPEEDFDPVRRQFRTLPSSTLRGRYAWHGLTRAKVAALKGGEEAEVTLYVDVGGEGEYNLNRFRFTVEVGGGKKPRVFFFPLQHLIRIVKEGGQGVEGGDGGAGGGGQTGRVGKSTVTINQVGREDADDKHYEQMEEAH